MEKKVSKTVFLTFVAAAISLLAFSSCLGDSESSNEFPNDFVYITRSSDFSSNYGINSTRWCKITFDGINALDKGDCVRMSYKINSNNTSGNLYNAENVTQHKVYTKKDGSQVELGIGQNRPDQSDIEVLGTLQVNLAVSDETLGDRWLFSFKRADNTGSIDKKYIPRLFYDKDEQTEIDSNGQSKPVGANQAIIDVRFYDGEGSSSSSGIGITSQDFVCDFSRFRFNYTPDFSNAQDNGGNTKYVYVVLKFRYKDADGKIKYLGNWSNTGYAMAFFKNV